MKKTLIVMLSILLTAGAMAQTEPPARDRFAFTYATPDGVAFFALADSLQGSEEATEEVMAMLNVDEAGAEEILAKLTKVVNNVNAESRLARKAHACSPGDPYEVKYQMYGVDEAIYDAALKRFRAGLDHHTQERLTKWILDLKLAMIYVRADDREIDRQSGKSSVANLRAHCGGKNK